MGKRLWQILAAIGILIICGVVAIIAVLLGALAWNSWAGNREWETLKAELHSKGEKLTLVEFTPPAVPDEENFFGDPLWKELLLENPGHELIIDRLNPPISAEEIARLKNSVSGQWKESNKRASVATSILSDPTHHHQNAESILTLLGPVHPLLDRIKDLSARPKAQFPFDYTQVKIPLKSPHQTYLLLAGQILRARAIAQLETGHSNSAFDDTQLIFRLADKLHDEPIYISLLVRVTLVRLALESIQKGLEKHAWNDAQLAAFDHELRNFDLLPEVAMTARRERGAYNQFYNHLITKIPSSKKARVAFFQRDQATFNRLTQEWIEHLDALNESGFRQKVGMEEKVLAIKSGWKRYFHLLTLLTLPATEGIEDRVLDTQSRVLMARIACAIERYRLVRSTLPGRLDALVPEFLPVLPKDIIAHEPFRYRRTAEDKYVLYSVAMNLVDDSGRTDANEDWVWGIPTKNLSKK